MLKIVCSSSKERIRDTFTILVVNLLIFVVIAFPISFLNNITLYLITEIKIDVLNSYVGTKYFIIFLASFQNEVVKFSIYLSITFITFKLISIHILNV